MSGVNKLLIVVDMQNDFIDGILGTEDAVKIVPKVVERIKKCSLDENESLIFTLDTHDDDYLNTLEGKNLPVEHCIYITDGWKLNEDVADAIFESFGDRDIQLPGSCFMKDTFGCRDFFGYQPIADADEITVIGLCTDICVISNAMIVRALNPNAKIIVDSSCCAGATKESHNNALEAMRSCQITVI